MNAIKALWLLSIIPLSSCIAEHRSPPIESNSIQRPTEESKIGVLDCKRALQIRPDPLLAAFKNDRKALLHILPEQFQNAQRKADTLKEQISALPIGSMLRREKQRLLLAVREEVLQERRWYEHILWGQEVLREWIGGLRDGAKVIATQEGFDLIFIVNRPDIDQVSGELLFSDDSVIAGVRGSRLVDVTERVMSQSAER